MLQRKSGRRGNDVLGLTLRKCILINEAEVVSSQNRFGAVAFMKTIRCSGGRLVMTVGHFARFCFGTSELRNF